MGNLKENDIRPDELMDKQRVYAAMDVGRLLSRFDEYIYIDCPACGLNESKEKFEKNGMKYVECQNCETFYINPRPTKEILEWFYRGSPNYAYWNDVIFPSSEAARREKIFVPRVNRLIELCEKYKIKTQSLLEVGAGFGTFCSELKNRNIFEWVVAVEPTPDLAETCRSKGIDVIEKPVESIQLEKNNLFDVVVNFEVIEHLFSPGEFIEAVSNLLRPGGIFILTCPNGKGFDVEALGIHSDTVDHEHLNYFNPQSLSKLLENYNLDVIESFTPGLLDADLVRNKVLAGKFDLSNQQFLKKILIDSWNEYGDAFQKFLIENKLSSNMWLVARKR